LKPSFAQLTLEEENIKKLSITDPIFTETALGLKAGGMSGPFEEEGSFHWIFCKERLSGGYKPYEQYQSNVKSDVMDMMYDDFIRKLKQESVVDVMKDRIDRMNDAITH